jgi:SAM-dependent methyltransferase
LISGIGLAFEAGMTLRSARMGLIPLTAGAGPNLLNHWSDPKCAKAFWSQSELPVFQVLVQHTLDEAAPQAGEHWLDLGCGGGTLTRGLWERSAGRVRSILGIDCNRLNAERYARLAAELRAESQIQFECGDFSSGLGTQASRQLDGVISGLSIMYAQHRDPVSGEWTRQAYDALLEEVARVLRPGGRFVFSVNVPEPSWWTVGLKSLFGGLAASRKPLRFLKNSLRMMRYGRWVKREARRGRFHFLPADEVTAKLERAGFTAVRHRLSYARQAYVFHAFKRA